MGFNSGFKGLNFLHNTETDLCDNTWYVNGKFL